MESNRLAENYKQGKRITLIGAFANIALSGLKVVAGILGHSAAMVADGVHSLSDLATDITVLLTLKLSSRPKDPSHPYGHGKIETFGALTVGIVLIVVAIGLFFEGIHRLLENQIQTPNLIALLAAAVSIVTKEILYQYTVSVGKRTGQPSLLANAWHHRSDALSSMAALVGIGGAMLGFEYMDLVAAIAVCVFIAQAGAKICWNAVLELIDTSADEVVLKKLESIVQDTPGITNHHALRARKVGSSMLIDLHIQVPADTSVAKGHRIAGRLKNRIERAAKNVSEVLVHVEPDTHCSLRPCMTLSQIDLYNEVKRIALEIERIVEVPHVEITFKDEVCTASVWVQVDPKISDEDVDSVLDQLRRQLIDELEMNIVDAHIENIETFAGS